MYTKSLRLAWLVQIMVTGTQCRPDDDLTASESQCQHKCNIAVSNGVFFCFEQTLFRQRPCWDQLQWQVDAECSLSLPSYPCAPQSYHSHACHIAHAPTIHALVIWTSHSKKRLLGHLACTSCSESPTIHEIHWWDESLHTLQVIKTLSLPVPPN